MLNRPHDLLEAAIASQLGSAAVLRVEHRGQLCHLSAHGQTRHGAEGRPLDGDTPFDLASLTKPLCVGTLAACLLETGRLELEQPLAGLLSGWRGAEREPVTLGDLLQHRSGLPDWRPYFATVTPDDPKNSLIAAICREPLLHKAGERILYSDPGFILLGAALEALTGQSLDRLFADLVTKPLKIKDLYFRPFDPASPPGPDPAFVATEVCPRRGLLAGRVHDDNAYAVGGVCGHAGLFGSAGAGAAILNEWRAALAGKGRLFSRESAVRFAYPAPSPPRAEFALAWDRPTWKRSPAGRYISPDSLGHWGFTGTSAWLDHDRDLSIILLTNRVHPSREEARIRALRLALHEAVYEELGLTAPGPWRKPPEPEISQHIHLIGVAGTGMGSLAGLLKAAGWRVTGSDQAVYPPMSTLLAEQGIEVRQPFGDHNLHDNPDLVVVGNVCSRDHDELVCAKRRGLALDSMPGVLERYFLKDHKPLVVAGTHGKTTTSAMLAALLQSQGQDPGFMIGGLVREFGGNFRLGRGPYFVVEGDEYDSAYFDKYPKFMHYRPHAAIVTSIEYDHADIYDSLEEIVVQFERFVSLIPPDGLLVACWDYETVRRVAARATCRVLRYGDHEQADWQGRVSGVHEGTTEFELLHRGEALARVRLPMSGAHNVANATAALALLHGLGLPLDGLSVALAGFQGVARRQQVRGVAGGVTVLDDFAHHPTAILTTLEGLRRAYPTGKLWVAFDPRTNTSSRRVFQERFASCFDLADGVWIGSPSRMDRIPPEERLDPERLVRDLAERGVRAHFQPDTERMAADIAACARPGDRVAILSNGSFGGLHERVLEALGKRE